MRGSLTSLGGMLGTEPWMASVPQHGITGSTGAGSKEGSWIGPAFVGIGAVPICLGRRACVRADDHPGVATTATDGRAMRGIRAPDA